MEPTVEPVAHRLRHDIRRGASLGARIVAALSSLLVLVGSGYAWASYRALTNKVTDLGTIASPDPSRPDVDGKAQNILVVGDDSRAGATPAELEALSTEATDGDNTDTMMLIQVPANGQAASVISFPRDSWVTVPGSSGDRSKLNGLYAIGKQNGGENAGMNLLSKGIYAMTGLQVDHFVKVGLLGFYRISLAIGGVDLCLNADQNASTDRDDFGSGYSGIDLHQGVNKAVQGKQALAFVRQRHGLPHGDLDRIHRQQYFLAAAFRKISSKGTLLDFGRQQALINAVGKSLSKDSSLNLLSFAGQMQDLSAGKLQFATIPVSGTPTIQFNGSPLSIVSLDWAEIPGFVERMTGVKVSPTESEAPDSVVGAVELARPAANPSAATSAVSSPQPSTDDETFNAGTASCID